MSTTAQPMTAAETSFADAGRSHDPARPRAPWRQSLIEMESGVRLGLRADSTLFTQLFIVSGVLTAAIIIGLPTIHWVLLVLGLAVLLSAAMFQQMLRMLLTRAAQHLPEPVAQAIKIGSAAVLFARIGAIIAVVLVFADRLRTLRG